jgi:hypothetical protein
MRKTPGLVGATLLLAGPSPTGWVGSKYVRARFPCDIAPAANNRITYFR